MNLVGYLITLANLQSFQESGGKLKDLSIRVSKVQTLASELKNQPEFALEGFRQTGYLHVGQVGKYLSQSLRNYLFKGDVDPMEEGVIVTLNFSDKTASQDTTSDHEDGTLSYYIHKKEDLSDEEKNNLYKYLDTVKERNRGKRAILSSFRAN